MAARTPSDLSATSPGGFTVTVDGYVFEFVGHDLTFDADGPDGGTVTGLRVSGDVVYQFMPGNLGDGLALSAETFNSIFGQTNLGVISQTLFSRSDNITGSVSQDRLYGYTGNDALSGGEGNDRLYGGAGDDLLSGGGGIDRAYGGSGNDWLSGGVGNDILDGGTGRDTALYGRVQQGVIVTLNGNKAVKAYVGATEIDILKNIENVYGSLAADRLTGDNRGNRLDGFAGKDILNGRGGNDIIAGGTNNDTLTGGPGADKFYFNSIIQYKTPNIDTITDFQRGVDKIYLDVSVFYTDDGPLPLGQLSPENFRSGPGVVFGKSDDYIVYDSRSGNLYFDRSGDGRVIIQFAHLNGAPNLKASDFMVADI
ncbi:MAG TPA: calcium-binding protein, partial [Bauldia sp.]|nr:calcium-binding protein [Bauldia sp.]